jgi:hypothetical protein
MYIYRYIYMYIGVEGALTDATVNRSVNQKNSAPTLLGSSNSIKRGYQVNTKTLEADAGLSLLIGMYIYIYI